jgi:hypothetical protein
MWSAVRERLTRKQGGHWGANAHANMMGMSSTESRYMDSELAIPTEPAAMIAQAVLT